MRTLPGADARAGQVPAKVVKRSDADIDDDILLDRLVRGIEQQEHFAAVARIEARHGKQPRFVGCE